MPFAVRRPPKSSAGQATGGQLLPALRAHAVRLLARREYSRAELESRLIAKGASREQAGALLDELARVGYQSDARFALAFAAHNARRYSRRSITAELRMKGVSTDAIDSALTETPLDDAEALQALWQRRFGRIPADERDKARQVRFLQSRGFAVSAILALLRRTKA
ncbi:MAG: regulatory protein RecX [Betaproteobacteria bacterium]